MPKAEHIIVIMTDTQRPDMLGCYGNPDARTPHLDRLASSGIRFDRAYTCQPVCGPARAALFTGLYPHSNASWANTMALDAQTRTVGQRFSRHGYHTAYIGKWHLDGGDYFGYGECPDGWDPDYWYDMRCYLEEHSAEDRLRSRLTKTIWDEDLTEDFLYGHRVSNRGIDFLERHSDEPFLLVLSYDEPHGPCLCPPEYVEPFKDYELPKTPSFYDTLEGKPEHHRVWAGDNLHADRDALKIKRPAFFGCNSYVDYEIGRVLDAIDEHAPDALVVYLSDHGDMLGSHCIDGKGPAMYEEITRIPFLVRWPGVTPEGVGSTQLVSHIDLVPTLLTAAELPVPNLLQGTPLQPTLADPDTASQSQVFIEFNRFEIDHDGMCGFQPIRCVRDERYKLAINLMTSDELYDLQADPYELRNLIDDPAHAAARDRLHDELLDWMNETRDPFRGYYWERRPWRTDARPASWKYTGWTRQREADEGEKWQLDYETGLPMKESARPK